MDPYYKLLSLTLVLLFSSTIFAHRIHPSDEYHANIPQSKSMLIIPTESDITWWRYLPSPRDHMSDERLRRGWGSGRRRRRRSIDADH